jgi:hypothetical protein
VAVSTESYQALLVHVENAPESDVRLRLIVGLLRSSMPPVLFSR